MRPIDTDALYRHGDLYDIQHETMQEDLPFYLSLLQETGDPVLELACGTGRLTLPIAAAGHEITGIDIAETMLSQARRKAESMPSPPRFITADLRQFDLDRRFRLIFFPFNSICHLHDRPEFEAMCRCVRRHLAPGGRFVIDVFVPDCRYLIRDPHTRHPVSEFRNPGGGKVVITESSRYDPAAQINHITWYFSMDGTEETAANNMRMYFPRELEALLHYNGFRILRRYGGYDRRPFTLESSKQLIVTESA